jgi:hypothetical protein
MYHSCMHPPLETNAVERLMIYTHAMPLRMRAYEGPVGLRSLYFARPGA